MDWVALANNYYLLTNFYGNVAHCSCVLLSTKILNLKIDFLMCHQSRLYKTEFRYYIILASVQWHNNFFLFLNNFFFPKYSTTWILFYLNAIGYTIKYLLFCHSVYICTNRHCTLYIVQYTVQTRRALLRPKKFDRLIHRSW